eukprot:261538-Karenia_brevis.AAC.1
MLQSAHRRWPEENALGGRRAAPSTYYQEDFEDYRQGACFAASCVTYATAAKPPRQHFNTNAR